ncbi:MULTISPECIES: FadR/GntR family transcriptional regulator [Corynebacterium]|uniref:GntR family transcriptional regulator n=1 Tax=Corynebacterium hadale TaxID=2026255 RepID=A0A269PAI7_9CORY|nr:MULTISPECIES: FadR/GntR family transcriptional regulator [Corynebacterium]MCG7254969.1 FadR family transcriptional regulator [Corynebacterium hadale]MCG7257230.1 FadR family transcriptional regulator [Corynebacterium hadale]MCG7265876.1 FadR family transcriptional regulator [Corynebacterium hadale]PAJ67736.1 GntR family transcriptional regulator [Corynebacterium hadale]WKC61163.1 Putative L-lactate dehydrogenase operon regulatory protein [Corynebacterium hadale]
MRRDLVTAGIEKLVNAIASGHFPEGQALPGEQGLADFLEVSRPTMREVVRALADRGVLEVVHGRGTFVLPRAQWRDVDTLVEVWGQVLPQSEVDERLTEVRRMIEVGSCGHAANNRTTEDITQLEACLERFSEAAAAGDLEGANRADVDFHNQILRATKNPFLMAVMRPLEGALAESRRRTTADPEVRSRADWHHRKILQAISAGDSEGAKNAMRAHMNQTWEDLRGSD